MPKYNKCIHREVVRGFTRMFIDKRWGRIMKQSTVPWFRCQLNDEKCEGMNCGSYEEEGD